MNICQEARYLSTINVFGKLLLNPSANTKIQQNRFNGKSIIALEKWGIGFGSNIA